MMPRSLNVKKNRQPITESDHFLVSTRHPDDWKRRLKNLGDEGPSGKIVLKEKPFLVKYR